MGFLELEVGNSELRRVVILQMGRYHVSEGLLRLPSTFRKEHQRAQRDEKRGNREAKEVRGKYVLVIGSMEMVTEMFCCCVHRF